MSTLELQTASSGAHCLSKVTTLLLSWPFLMSLSVLIANDVYLKYEFPGLVTGKLSDIAGVYLVSYLGFGIFPRAKFTTVLLIISLFSVWKSPLSQPLIDGINLIVPVRIGRVVDYSDLIAFLVIPVALRSAGKMARPTPIRPLERFAAISIALISLVAVTGTSMLMPVGDFSIRNTDSEIQLQTIDVMDAAQRVAKKYDLECGACDPGAFEGSFQSDDLSIEYWFDESKDEIRFLVRVRKTKGFILPQGDSELLEDVRRDLKSEFAELSPAMEYIERLTEHPYR